MSTNSSASLASGDRKAAQEILNGLRAKPSIVAAGIYTLRGEPFARYSRTPGSRHPGAGPAERRLPRPGDRLELLSRIRLGGERVGTLYIAADARDRNARLKQYAIIAAGIVLVVAARSRSFCRGGCSEAFPNRSSRLARVAGLVSQHKNYSVRADADAGLKGSDEIADLMTGFNSMLAEIEQRDLRLLLHRRISRRRSPSRISRQEKCSSPRTPRESRRGQRSTGPGERADPEQRHGRNHGCWPRRPAHVSQSGGRTHARDDAERHGRKNDSRGHPSFARRRYAVAGGGLREHAGHAVAANRFATADDTYWRRDGTSFPVEYSSTPMFDEDGSQLGAVVMFRDVTERRAIERLKSEFVSTVSHELRTPLTSIRGALGLLGQRLLGPSARRAQRMLEIAVTNTDRLVRLINDILDLERIDSGKVELERGPVDATRS